MEQALKSSSTMPENLTWSSDAPVNQTNTASTPPQPSQATDLLNYRKIHRFTQSRFPQKGAGFLFESWVSESFSIFNPLICNPKQYQRNQLLRRGVTLMIHHLWYPQFPSIGQVD